MGYLFGPVQSKRLGISLGVDVIPHKICNFDCVYCECGKTITKVNRRGHFVRLDALLKEFDAYLFNFGDEGFDVLTLTGSGETTLEIQLKEIIEGLRQRTQKPIAVLTNASLITDPQVQEALASADIVLPSLDAAHPDTFRKVDRPHPWITVENIILGLFDFKKNYPKVQLWLEILMVEGLNDTQEEIESLKRVIALIHPDRVHVGTVTRPPAYPEFQAISEEKLSRIQNLLSPESSLFANHPSWLKKKQVQHQDEEEVFNRVLETLKRRPCPLEELKLVSGGISERCLQEKLTAMIQQGLLEKIEKDQQTFFVYRPTRLPSKEL